MTSQRESFEEWMKDNGTLSMHLDCHDHSDQPYLNSDIQRDWECWQAATARKVKLPDGFIHGSFIGQRSIIAIERKSVIEAIKAAGYSVEK